MAAVATIEGVSVPLDVRLRFGRAAVQVVADNCGVEILHIKGDAVDAALRPRRRGTDVDILVRPDQVARLDEAVRREGWRLYSSFDLGSPFGHAQTYWHDSWGHLDLHRSFPGVMTDPAAAFEVLSRNKGDIEVLDVMCSVPSVPAQAAVLLLNAARAGAAGRAEVDAIWEAATGEQRETILSVVIELRAHVAFAAAVGGLESYGREPEYHLWKAVTQSRSRTAEWWGRLRAAPTAAAALRVIARAPRVNIERLEHKLGHTPKRREVLEASVRRPITAAADAWSRWRGTHQ